MTQNSRRILAHTGALGIAFGAAVLYLFPPAVNSFYPRCPIFTLFHVQCPGCGATRALAALLHGHLSEAVHWNAAFVLLLPFLAAFFAVAYSRAVGKAEFAWPRVSNRWLTATLGFVLAFAILRDIYPL